jgi:hypothetical protein
MYMDFRSEGMDVWLQRLSEEIESAVEGMSTAHLEWAPEGKWNAAKILEHLGMAFGGTAKALERTIAAGTAPVIPSPSFQQRLVIFVLTGLGYFPNGRKAPDFVQPKGIDAQSALKLFRENLRRMEQAIATAEQRWGKIRIATHPIIGPLTAHQWRRFHYVHTRHHAKQVRALKNAGSAQGAKAA